MNVGDFYNVNYDIIKQAKALGKKINPMWSKKRMEEEHQKWTQEIMRMEAADMEDEIVDWPQINLPENFELITTKRRLFEEGATMHHCIFTNYWDRVRTKRYMVLHVKDSQGNAATAGLKVNGTVELDAVHAKYNKPPSAEIKKSVTVQTLDEIILYRDSTIMIKDERLNVEKQQTQVYRTLVAECQEQVKQCTSQFDELHGIFKDREKLFNKADQHNMQYITDLEWIIANYEQRHNAPHIRP
jgi:hypothetical protein